MHLPAPGRARAAYSLSLVLSLFFSACNALAPASTVGPVSVALIADGQTRTLTTRAATVHDLLAEAGASLGELDKVTPSEVTPISDGLTVRVVRVTETFEVEEVTIPFARQTVRNESLAEGETRLLQRGVNGAEELTYRLVYEDGVLVSRNAVRRMTVAEPIPEIVMVGAQPRLADVPIAGVLAYLSAGNAIAMRGTTAQRTPLTLSSDLDGRVFAFSPDGRYLLYTRVVTSTAEAFNTLWALEALEPGAGPIDLRTRNVLWADWWPGRERRLVYSTGEPRTTAPGWQAFNDLRSILFDSRGNIVERLEILPATSAGQYAWWGTTYAWSPGGEALAFSRADVVGLIHPISRTVAALAQFTPFQTFSDWVWTPGIAFSPEGSFVYSVVHGPPVGLESPDRSLAFDLTALAADGSFSASLVPRAGMWAAPLPSPSGDLVAFLQAINPADAERSRYRLAVIDRDGSNLRVLFPPEGEPGLSPQTLAWSPDGSRIALISGGDLWLVDLASGLAEQLTGDGLASRPIWIP